MKPEIAIQNATPDPMIRKNDTVARWIIVILSVVVFGAVVVLSRVSVDIDLGFDVHLFATFNAIVNSMVSVLLLGGLVMVKQQKFELHKRIMIAAILLSALFLVSYICHHLFAGDTKFGGVGTIRTIYFIILITHIFLAAIILPFILFTAYRALTGEYNKHKKLARITWPIWFYVSVTGVIVYLMISPYY
jgi:putative membrane protein